MKNLLKISFVLMFSLSLMGCSMGQAKTEEITDEQTITQMNTLVQENVKTFYDVEVPSDLTYEYNASKRFVGTQEDPKGENHHANIFQAVHKTKDPVSGQLLGYGGVLTPDNTGITGLIINIYHDKDENPKEFAETDLVAIATNFLKEKGLVGADEEINFIEINKKASSSAVSVLNFETATKMYAVGVDLFSGTPAYFEFLDRPAETPAQ